MKLGRILGLINGGMLGVATYFISSLVLWLIFDPSKYSVYWGPSIVLIFVQDILNAGVDSAVNLDARINFVVVGSTMLYFIIGALINLFVNEHIEGNSSEKKG